MKNKFFKKIPKVFYTVGSLAGLAAINYTLFNSSLVFLYILVLLVHELGHFFAAKYYKANPQLPIFIPLPFIGIGITKIKNLNLSSQKNVLIFGPIVGSLTALLLIIFNGIFKFTSYYPLVYLLIGEIFFNYIGSDGKKYRKINRSLDLCIS